MSVDTTLAVLYAQSGLSTNIANAAAVAPQASLAMSRVLAVEQARHERQQVEKNEKADEARINREKDGSGGFFATRLRNRKKIAAEKVEEALPTTAMLGNLLNVKV